LTSDIFLNTIVPYCFQTTGRERIRIESFNKRLLPPVLVQLSDPERINKKMEELKDEMIHEHAPDGSVPTKSALVTKKTRTKKKAVHLTWDEHQIEEHDQLRGTRMKIDEPDTPFAYANSNDGHSDAESSTGSHRSKDKELNWAHLENKLGAVAAVRDGLASSPSMSSCGGGPDPDSDFELEKDKKRENMKMKEFEMHRKTHYNEFEAMRQWRDATHDDDDDDEDDE